jgi:hypothetical protein
MGWNEGPPKVMKKKLICAAAALTCMNANLHAQLTVDWSVSGGGGGTSTNVQYSVSGTIGQPATEAMSAGTYTVQSGFWGLIAAIQTPGAPRLQILNLRTNAVALVWPSTSTKFILQQNTSPNTTNWVAVNTTPSDDGTNRSVVIYPAAGNRYFRLKWP